MKKWLVGMIALVVTVLLGGWMYVDHATKENTYRTNFNHGNEALKNKDYHQAKKDFKVALTAKPDSKKANGSVSQVEKFMDGENELSSNDFATAKASFKMAANDENGSTDLANQAKQKIRLVNGITEDINHFNEIYKMAVEQHNDKTYQLSNDTLAQILQDDKINQSYYEDVLAKAKDLKKSNDKAMNVPKQTPLTTSSQSSRVTTNQAADTTNPDLSKFNVYTNPQEYANRFVNSGASSNTSDTDNTKIENGPVSTNADPYNVYTNPQEYANRFN